jgi:hypothetical protein
VTTAGVDTSDWAVSVPIGYSVGRWRVTAAIATGSWASVYEARNTAEPLAPPVALKLLPTGTVTARQLSHLAQMAQREAALHRALRHPRLIRAYEVLTVDDRSRPELDGTVALVMQRAKWSLAEVLRANGDRPVPGAPGLVEQICEGLAHMHRAGWVHGDLKPGNVLLMDDGSVRLGDFGLSAELEGTHGYLPPIGSSDYVPPERWTERLGGKGLVVRPSADIWALGLIAYQLFTGVYPFAGSGPQARATAAARFAAGHHRLLFPSPVPVEWRRLIGDCLAPTHQQRRRHDAASLLGRIKALRTNALPRSPLRRRMRAVAAILATAMAGLTAASAADVSRPGFPPAAGPSGHLVVPTGATTSPPAVGPSGQPATSTGVTIRPAAEAKPAAFADIDGDGRADLIGISSRNDDRIADRNQGWNAASDMIVGRDRKVLISGFGEASRTTFADIDGDGRADLIGISGPDNDLTAYRNQGWDNPAGVFVGWDRKALISGFGQLAGLKFADVDGDRRADLVGVSGPGNDITAYRNQGWDAASGIIVGWDRRTLASGFGGPALFALADIDGDRRAELIGQSGQDQDLTAYRNQGWDATSGIYVGGDRRALVSGFGPLSALRFVDLDADARADLVAADLTAYRNQGWHNPSGVMAGWDRTKVGL